ncbi:Agenet-like domain-containing protein [Hirschfeldia incana]|nr:Agenet-like domain-containing protein [Hirschfeldia incana]
MKIGDEIEVSSDEEGFKGSWFRAILEDPLPQSGKKKLNVSLLADDGSSTTRITTYRRFIRPVPSENLFTAAAEFEEGCVVEASRGGGWWTGVVVKKINDEDAVWVYFDSPPDLFQFQTGQLRQHLYWVKPRVKVSLSNKKSTFRCGTMVEVKVDEDVDVWVPSVIVKELGDKKSFVVKPFKNLSWDDGGGGEAPKPNRTVGLGSIRLTPGHVSVGRSYGLMESVEVFIDPGWRPGRVKSILCDERYTVFMKGTKQSLVLTHDAIRPSHDSVLRNTSEVNATSLSSEENGEMEVPEEHSREDDNRKRKRGGAEHTPVLSETTATGSVSSLTSSPARTATPLNQTDAETEDITVQPESSEECNIRKRTKEHNLSSTPVVQAKDTTLVLPFVKKSPFWKILETSEGFQRAPQTPHFSPLLKESKEQFREGLAFGMMLTHSGLLESFTDLEPHVTMSELNSLKASFAELDKHGFSVSAPLARINKLLALKDTQRKKMEERNGFDREIMALKEGVGEMEDKILELERQQVALKEQRDAACQSICQIESSARDNGIELDNLESEFKATSSAPWGEN